MIAGRATNGAKRCLGWLALSVALLVALVPWWRNHDRLRDFYDYGTYAAAVGRIAAGERPYVDFESPLQSLTFVLLWGAERVWGERFLALTYANGAFIALALFALWWALGRCRVDPMLAAGLAGGIVVASASQHGIMSKNALGLWFLALAAWGAARAPLLARERWGWNAVVLAALIGGGMNKLNYQAVALAWVGLWTLRAVWPGGADWRRGALTLAAWIAAATAVPVGLELAWTGATLAEWWHNVAALPASRGGLLAQLFDPGAYLRPPHDYYRPLWLRPAGLLGTLGLLGTAAALWPGRSAADRAWLAVATLGALTSGAALLVTNFEIVLMAAATYLALAVAMVLGFAGPSSPFPLARAGRLWPALALAGVGLAALAWPSAWAGARSQFGHENVPRRDYVDGAELPGRFAYLRGLKIMPRYAQSLRALDEWIESGAVSPDGRGLLVANGTEWLVRALPQARLAGLPLWFHHGTTYGPVNEGNVANKLLRPGRVHYLLGDLAWDVWQGLPAEVVERHFAAEPMGPLLQLRVRRNPNPLDRPFELLAGARTNLDARRLHYFGHDRGFYRSASGPFLGAIGRSALHVRARSYRLTGEAVLLAYPAAGAVRRATFRAVIDEGDGTEEIWSADLEVSAAALEARRAFELQPEGRSVRLEVRPHADGGEGLLAGWGSLLSLHAGPLDGGAPAGLTGAFGEPVAVEAARLFATEPMYPVFGFGAVVPAPVVPKSGGVAVALPAELWIRVDEASRRLRARYQLEVSGAVPQPEIVVRGIWSRAGRVEVLHERRFRPDDGAPSGEAETFEGHFPEAIGWFGLLVSAWPKGTPAPGVQVVWSEVRVE